MDSQRLLKRIHVCGTLWFLLCAATLLVFSLYQAGFHWWLIFSISGYSAILLFFLFTIYLFAIYQGVVRNQTVIEHPLSTSVYYVAFYDLAPFLGSLAGFLGLSSYSSAGMVINTVTEGTLATTFLVWTVFDPMIGVVETLLPASKAHRKQRMEQARHQKLLQKEENDRLLERLERQEQQQQECWNAVFSPIARKVAELQIQQAADPLAKKQIIERGALAWKTGQITCMRHFHRMILEQLAASPNRPAVDYIALWWDGIGTWRKPKYFHQLHLSPAV